MALEHLVTNHTELACTILVNENDVIVHSLTGKPLQFVILSRQDGGSLVVEQFGAVLTDSLKGDVAGLVLQVQELEELALRQFEVAVQLSQLRHVVIIAWIGRDSIECGESSDVSLWDEVDTTADARKILLSRTCLDTLVE